METDVITGTPSPLLTNSTEPSHNNMWKYIVIFLILALLGFNLFTYVGNFSKFLGELSDRIIALFRPILAFFGYGVTETAKKTIDLTASGSKKAIDVASGTLTSGINVLQSGLSRVNKDVDINTYIKQNEANLDRQVQQPKMQLPIPDDAGSVTQLSKGKNKSGFCYIGEDRGFRSCISVGEGDTCMSGDIFPSQELCINPNLRA